MPGIVRHPDPTGHPGSGSGANGATTARSINAERPEHSVNADDRLWVDPQLASLTSRRVFEPGWIFERKLDGVRALAIRTGGRTTVYSRNRNDVSRSYPEIVAALDEQVGGDTFVMDGEIVAFDGEQTSFSRLQHRIHLTD